MSRKVCLPFLFRNLDQLFVGRVSCRKVDHEVTLRRKKKNTQATTGTGPSKILDCNLEDPAAHLW